MKTKLVYVVASSDEDYYMEQAIVSAWSARYYNPDAIITLVCDQDTNVTLQTGFRQQYAKELFDEVIVRQFPASSTMVGRSREMKTNLRNIVAGDYLYLDSDTIVCKDLSFVDQFPFDLGFVFDQNCSFENFIMHETVLQKMNTIYKLDVSDEHYYYNSGVSFVRDTSKNHEFHTLWNRNWKYSYQQFDDFKDQQSLFKTNIDMGYPIHVMEGEMNCQVLACINHLSNAAIIHIYNNFAGTDAAISPFHDKQTYKTIKNTGISKTLETQIISVKSSFSSPIFLLTGEQAKIWRDVSTNIDQAEGLGSKSLQLLLAVKHHAPGLFSMVEKTSSWLLHLRKCLRHNQITQKPI